MKGRMPRAIVIPKFKYAKKLSYIESTGTQRIDTGFKPNQNTRIVLDMNFVSGAGVFLSANSGSSGLFGVQMSNNYWYMYYGSVGGASKTAVAFGKRLTLDMNKNNLYLDGTLIYSLSSATFSCNYTLPLFCLNIGGSFSTYGSIKLYSCQIYDNDVLVRDFIPVMDHDGMACLYDKVTKELYHNAGSGSFGYAEV